MKSVNVKALYGRGARKLAKGVRAVSMSAAIVLCSLGGMVHAEPTRFDVISFRPAVDESPYFSIYGSQTLKPMQGHLGFNVDFANRPLQFVGIGSTTSRQSIVDNLLVGNLYGSLGVTDWLEFGINLPVVFYNWYFQDSGTFPKDHATSMADIFLMSKIRILDIEEYKVGLALQPYVTLPSGDAERYMGSGVFTGGANLIADFNLGSRFSFSMNAGAKAREDITRNGVRFNDRFLYGAGAAYAFDNGLSLVAEIFGSTNISSMFEDSDESPLEAGGGVRYAIADSGVDVQLGGTAGIIDGVGAPRYRVQGGVRWTPAPKEKEECIQAPLPPPDPRIRGGKIIIPGKIFFDTDKATIKPLSFPILDEVVTIMQRNPELTLVEIQGHTDTRGSDTHNMKLSQARSESVRQYLINKGVESTRLTAKGYGFRVPIASNDTKEGMSENRRVEFVIMERAR